MTRAFAIVAAAVLSALAAGATTGTAATQACRVAGPAPGWEAVFGYRSSYARAASLRSQAQRVGFAHLAIEQVGCPRWAVSLRGLKDRAQALELRAEARRAHFDVIVRCWPLRDLDPAWEAVFGSGLTQHAGARLRRRAAASGFVGLKLLHEPCSNTWLVELDGIQTLRQAQQFRAEAKHAGFAISLRRH